MVGLAVLIHCHPLEEYGRVTSHPFILVFVFALEVQVWLPILFEALSFAHCFTLPSSSLALMLFEHARAGFDRPFEFKFNWPVIAHVVACM